MCLQQNNKFLPTKNKKAHCFFAYNALTGISMLKENKEIYCLRDYLWVKGELISTGKVNYKIKFTIPGCIEQTSFVKKEKCAFPDDLVVIVWMTGKGVNGRGGYRVERELYPNLRVPARNIFGSWSFDSTGFVKE